MTSLESKLKKIALNLAIDALLRSAQRSPQRCARNLVELGSSAYPNALNKEQLQELSVDLLVLCKNHQPQKTKERFFSAFDAISNPPKV
ncbi:MAG: hypothetical protein K0R90_981 [Oscillospiraceae bacterium]|jgi:hypothetical protein|nr:hypothetical protein [Oscillospiraceae bacterium]